MHSPVAVAAHRKPCGGSTRIQRCPGLCHGPAQKEIFQGSPMQRCFNVGHTTELNLLKSLLTITLFLLAEGRQSADNKVLSKHRGRSQQSPDKSSSRSPLRNTTQDSNVHIINSVDFREPLASYRYSF